MCNYYKIFYYGRSFFWLLDDINFPFSLWDMLEFYILTFIQRRFEDRKLKPTILLKLFMSKYCSIAEDNREARVALNNKCRIEC